MAEIEPSGLKANPNEYYDRQIVESMISGDLPPVSTSHVINYAIEIDISDNTDIPDEPVIGLFNDALLNGGDGGSAFRIITGRPNYDGSTVVPTGELSTANAIKWGEGVISSRSSLGSPVRIINVLTSGDYGSLSGVNFSLDNIKIESGTFEGQPLFDIIDDENFFMLNRRVRYYVVIDDVFYNVWTGIVQKYSYNETKIDLICQDNFQNVHKVLPPQIVNTISFPNAVKKTIGKPIPVTFGNVNNARLLNVKVKNEPIPIVQANGQLSTASPLREVLKFDDSSGNHNLTKITFRTGSLTFASNELNGKFIRFILDGGGDQAYKITNTFKTSPILGGPNNGANKVEVFIKEDVDVSDFIIKDENVISPIQVGTWVEIFDFESTYVVSDQEVTEYPSSESGAPKKVSYFDKDQEDFVEVSEITENFSTSDILGTKFPGITAFTDVVDFEGKFFKLFPLIPEKITQSQNYTAGGPLDEVTGGDLGTAGTEYPELIDLSRSTKRRVEFTQQSPTRLNRFSTQFILHYPQNLANLKFQKFFILFDIDIEVSSASVSSTDQTFENFPIDILGEEPTAYKGSNPRKSRVYIKKDYAASEKLELRLIPPSYFNEVGSNGEHFGNAEIEMDLVQFYDETSQFRAHTTSRILISTGGNSIGAGETVDVDFYQIIMAGSKEISIINDDIFIKTKGQKTTSNTNETDNIYRIIESILTDYDDLSLVNDIDISGIESRKQWGAGRQLLDRKSSFTYLKQIATQTFIGLFPSRNGKRKLSAFRDAVDPVAEFSDTSGNVVQGTISPIVLSDINQVYNEFEIKYEWIEPASRFDKSVFIKKVDQDTFPERHVSTDGANDFEDNTAIKAVFSIGIADDTHALVEWGSIPAQFTEVGTIVSYESEIGIFDYGTILSVDGDEVDILFENLSGFTDGQEETGAITMRTHSTRVKLWTTFAGGMTDYNRASEMWSACHQAYLKTLIVNPIPAKLSDCKWFVDESNFKTDPGMYSSPVMLLEHMVEWSTRQKEMANFHIPITPEHAELELLDFVTFRDKKHTAGEQKEGYISKIKINPPTDTIILELTLIPSDIEDIRGCLIIETGTSPDTITELGTNPDTITEPSDC